MNELRTREQIYEDIQNERPFVLRHENVDRVWTHMNGLLDELLIVQYEECYEILHEEGEGQPM